MSKPPSPLLSSMPSPDHDIFIRKCINIRSQARSDVQCALNATHGDFCHRHWKHPRRYVIPTEARTYNIKGIRKIQRAWRHYSKFIKLFHQGIGALNRDLSTNTSELYSLEPVKDVPALYYFSFVDGNHLVWAFDIRSLSQMLSMGTLRLNPYTRDPIGQHHVEKIVRRLSWLRARKYSILYPIGAELTADQLWSQRILEIFMKIESFGYHVSCDWFQKMSIDDHKEFYRTLYELWNQRLNLTAAEQERIVPGFSGAQKLFKFAPAGAPARRSLNWWEKQTIGVMETLLHRSPDREQNKMGALYCIMGLVKVCDEAADGFPWLVEAMA